MFNDWTLNLFIVVVFIVLPGSIVTLSVVVKNHRYGKKIYTYHGVKIPLSRERFYEILSRRFPYFNKLSTRRKDLFIKRIRIYLYTVSFETRQGLVLRDEMIVLVAATFVRMSAGMRSFLPQNFKQIILYPYTYYSPISKTRNKGESGFHGQIVLSWKDFEDELENPDDGLNLGYHEFAHAMLLDSIQTGFSGMNFDQGYQKFSQALVEHELVDVAKQSGLFRGYAFTNKMEFFAVATELFFERPADLRASCHAIYSIFCVIYNINPLLDEHPIMNKNAVDS
jgi:Mlc titration factor MtfA (ptsG expression regulator)